VHVLAEVHDTPSKIAPEAPPPGFAVGWITQLVPSQLSANVAVEEPAPSHPTAVQALADGHDTPNSSLNVLVPLTAFGVGWIDQLAAPADAGSAANTAITSNEARTQARPPIHPLQLRERHSPSPPLNTSNNRHIDTSRLSAKPANQESTT
jgi:hypothetical protein